MDGPRGVVYAMLVAFGIFVLSGAQGSRKLANGIARATGGTPRTAAANEPTISGDALVGWAVLFVMFIALADIDATSELATAFAFLLLLTILLAFGPDAFANISSLFGAPASNGGGGGGRGRKP